MMPSWPASNLQRRLSLVAGGGLLIGHRGSLAGVTIYLESVVGGWQQVPPRFPSQQGTSFGDVHLL